MIIAVLSAGAAVSRAAAGVEVGGGSYSGSRDYAEQSISLKLRVPLRGSDDFEQPLYALYARRIGREWSGSPGTSYTNELGVSAEYLRQVGLGFTLWVTPSFSEDVNSYRWRAWSGSLYVKNDGWWPKVSIVDPPKGGPVQNKWSAAFRQTSHEERVQPPGKSLQWTRIEEMTVLGSVEEKFWNMTTLIVGGEQRSYNRSIAGGIQRGDLFSVEQAGAGLPIELLGGFPGGAWGVGMKQDVTKWFSLAGEFKRYSYETGPAKVTDNYRAGAVIGVPDFFSVAGRYEVFQGRRQKKAEYAGMDVELRF